MSVSLRLRTAARFMASIFSGVATTVRKDGLATYIDVDYSGLAPLASFDPSAYRLAGQSTVDGSFGSLTIAQVFTAAQTQQIKTSAGNVNVSANDGLIVVNKTVGASTTVNLPAASNKVGPVKIVDWKGDAGTNNITIAVTGTDKLNGNLTSWTIAADGGSVVLTPLSDGSGYAV